MTMFKQLRPYILILVLLLYVTGATLDCIFDFSFVKVLFYMVVFSIPLVPVFAFMSDIALNYTSIVFSLYSLYYIIVFSLFPDITSLLEIGSSIPLSLIVLRVVTIALIVFPPIYLTKQATTYLFRKGGLRCLMMTLFVIAMLCLLILRLPLLVTLPIIGISILVSLFPITATPPLKD